MWSVKMDRPNQEFLDQIAKSVHIFKSEHLVWNVIPYTAFVLLKLWISVFHLFFFDNLYSLITSTTDKSQFDKDLIH